MLEGIIDICQLTFIVGLLCPWTVLNTRTTITASATLALKELTGYKEKRLKNQKSTTLLKSYRKSIVVHMK